MPDVRLVVNGRKFGGWKSVRVTRSIETLAGSFELDVTDRWSGQAEPWPIAEEDECRVEIDGTVVINGYVDRRSIALAKDSRSISFAGRDRAAALVDCSTILDKWTFRKKGILDIARQIAEPFNVTVSVQAGLTLPAAPDKVVIDPGDSAFEAIVRAAESAEVLVVSDGAGGIVLTRSGSGRATPLVQGNNVLQASVDYDASERFRRYVVATQVSGSNGTSGDATRIRAEAFDEDVRRAERVIMLRPDDGLTVEAARRRGDWEARIRAARAETVSIAVRGWLQPSGGLWPINALVRASVPAIGVDGDMLITQAEYSLDEGGEVTQLRLVRPDAFTPEPRAVVKRKSGGSQWWKQLTVGDG